MKNPWIICLCVLIVLASLCSPAWTKNARGRLADYTFVESPHVPRAASDMSGSMYQAAAAGTTVLGWWQFDNPIGGVCDSQGWTSVDEHAQMETYFHVDGNDPMDSGCHAATPINGNKSMWCGQWATSDQRWCGWMTLPGYGDYWDQWLVSDTLVCDTLSWSWTIVWDVESGYDFVYAEYWDPSDATWQVLPVNSGTGYYDGAGGPLVENYQVVSPAEWTVLRYRFMSDGAWSDEDGLWPTDEGALKVDDITVACHNGPVYFHDFEAEACGDKQTLDGFWQSDDAPGFGNFARLVHGSSLVQQDPCFNVRSCMWVFFDDPARTNYACGGWPLQGAMPYGPDGYGHYLDNEIWSPWVPNAGSGSEYIFSFLTYRDLPLDNLQFYRWGITGRVDGGCPFIWDSFNFVYYGGQKDWIRRDFQVGSMVPHNTTEIRISLGAIDMCVYWCGIYGYGSCHSHAPLFDQVRLVRVDTYGPQWAVRHIDLWQDNFPDEGGVDPVTSFARCDMAQDILPDLNADILPGDSLVVEVSDPNDLADDNTVGRPGKAVYAFVRVTDRFDNAKAGKNGIAIQSPDDRRWAADPNAGTVRWPWVGEVTADGVAWDQYKMDYVFSPTGSPYSGHFCCDLMDIGSGPNGPHYNHANENIAANTGVFTPGDVINYFFGAKNTLGEWSYWHRTYHGQGQSHQTTDIDVAAADPCEWSVLPDAGLHPGDEGDILLVDAADDRVVVDDRRLRGGPPQAYFDWVWWDLGLQDRVDRFDVLGPSSLVGNTLGSRVKSYTDQLIGDPVEIYQQIFWNTSDLSSGLRNSGGGLYKPNDFTPINVFLTNHPGDPGILLAGDDLAYEWEGDNRPSYVAVKSTYMNFNVVDGIHTRIGEPVSPLLRSGVPGSYGVFDWGGYYPDGHLQFYAFGGCSAINDFDVLQATGQSRAEMTYPATQNAAVLAQATPTALSTARFILAGFGFDFIRDDGLHPLSNDRTYFIRDILWWFQNIVPDPTSVEFVAFENRLENAYPNPFNPTTTIKYSIKEPGHVSLKIYNVAGQLIRTLVDEVQVPREAGFSEKWNGSNDAGGPVSSGVYFYKLTTEGFTQTKKMVLLK